MANKKVNRQTVRPAQSRRRREEERKEKEQLRNRVIAGIGAVLLLVVVVFYVFQLRGAADQENDNTTETAGETGMENEGETAEVTEPEGTLLEGDRPLAELEPAERDAFYEEYPEMIIDTDNSYQAVIRTENGDMILQLFDDESPLAVNSFVFLATQGFYDGVVFHRVLEGFMAQSGDPTGTGGGGPGYVFDDEVENGLIFDQPYLLAMAKPSMPDSNGSQFFITFGEPSHLNGIHTVFGELIGGEDVLSSISLINPENPADQDRVGDVMERIDIYESGGE